MLLIALVGHSERRLYHNENNNLLNKKILNVQKNNIKAILCIGESLLDRRNSKTLRVLGNQLNGALKNNINPNLLKLLMNLFGLLEPAWFLIILILKKSMIIFLINSKNYMEKIKKNKNSLWRLG